ncbi:MFS transporter [Pseudonocardia spinosispora]|uniref:MFS transporter n=1 Tax=Pseudonocardia spinosispora TaxID=103441 RepID=UPI000A0425DD|nr:MFS transporter [Pseudonocardia spinosispora]
MAAQLPPDDPGTREGAGPGPWRYSGFRWLFVGQSVSLAGGSMTPVALSFAVLDASGRSADLALVLATQSLTLLTFLLLGGAVADRVPRDAVLMSSNLGAFATQATVAGVLLSGHYHLGLIAALEAANGACAAFTTPALRGVLPQLVEPAALPKANSIMSSVRSATKVLGPTVAGLVVAVFGGGWAIAVDAASFAVAAFCMTRLALGPTDPAARTSLADDLREGFDQFRSRSWVVVIVATFAGCNFILAGVWLVLGPSIAQRGIGSGGWGVVLSAQAVGMLIMGLLMYRITPTHPLRWGQAGAALFALPLLALGLSLPTPWLATAALLAGAGAAVTGITWDTALQQHVPQRALSRVASYDNLGSFATVPLGQLAVVPIAAALGATHVALGGAIVWAALTLGALAAPSVRDLHRVVR